jgi:hypothetical protein
MSAARAGAALAAMLLLAAPAAADEPHADVCLELLPGAVAEREWRAVEAVVAEVLVARPTLYPEPVIVDASPRRLDIASGHFDPGVTSGAPCLEPGAEWTARFGRAFLTAGAERMLEEAPTTPGIDSSVVIEWYPDETRLRTRLDFAGPLDIPNGTCWVDDTLTIDEASGTVVASGEQGLETSLFAEGACRRFFDHLPDGGAGEQAVTLLPPVVELPGGGSLHFVAEAVTVTEEAVIVAGSLGRS